MNRFIDLPETVSLINQERTNNKLYVSLVAGQPRRRITTTRRCRACLPRC